MKTEQIPAPWTNVYGLARSMLALETLSTLALHDADRLFRPLGYEIAQVTDNPLVSHLSLFSLLAGERLQLARWIAIGILLLVISGWRPRITGLLHWWVSFSFATSAVLLEGGDQITANLTLLLLPVTLTDPRTSHWAPPTAPLTRSWQKVLALVALSALVVVRLQVAGIYLHASIGKMRVAEWQNGTALYYWFLHPVFGVSDWLRPFVLPLLTNGVTVTAMTWGVIALELFLFAGLVMEKRYRPLLLKLGLLFHFGIVLVHGLGAFFLAMAGALILYLRPWDEPFGWPAVLVRLPRALRDRGRRLGRLRAEKPTEVPISGPWNPSDHAPGAGT